MADQWADSNDILPGPRLLSLGLFVAGNTAHRAIPYPWERSARFPPYGPHLVSHSVPRTALLSLYLYPHPRNTAFRVLSSPTACSGSGSLSRGVGSSSSDF